MSQVQMNIGELKKPLSEGFGLPSNWYTDPAIFEIERQEIFRKNWLFFGHVEEVGTPGSYKATTVGTFPVVVARTTTGELKGFLNICRHRLHKLVDDGIGNRAVFRCHYHGWAFDLDGKLKGIPRSSEMYKGDVIDFENNDFNLIPVRLETWGTLIFVNLDLDAKPLMEAVGSLAGIARERGANFNTHPHTVSERIIAVNWKVYVDNVIECYHCPTVHPTFSENYDTSSKSAKLICDSGRFALGIPRRGDEYQEDDPKEPKYEFHAYFLPPNFWLSCRGSRWLFLQRVEPIDAEHIKLVSQFCFPDDMDKDEIEELVAGAEKVNDEDSGVALSVQRGHRVGGLPQSYIMPHSEHQLREFAEFVYSSVTGAK